MYVCMYVCMYGSVHCNHVGVGRESFLMDVCMCVCMYVWKSALGERVFTIS